MNDSTPQPERPFHSGFVAIAGLPNVGKSTLMNGVIGAKVSIATSRPQTTRNRILGIHTIPAGQIVFVDTPGIHRPDKYRELNTVMVETAVRSLGEVDLVLFVVDCAAVKDSVRKGDLHVAELIGATGVPCVLALNKIDRLPGREALLPLIAMHERVGDLEPVGIIPISATKKDGFDELCDLLVTHLPEGPQLYPEDMLTDQAERFIAAEIVREKLTLQTRQELPYSAAVTVETFSEDRRRGLLRIRAVIVVERDSQKGVVIGKGGQRLKQIGSQARGDLERFFSQKVYLDLHVKVAPDWSSDRNQLKKLGYGED